MRNKQFMLGLGLGIPLGWLLLVLGFLLLWLFGHTLHGLLIDKLDKQKARSYSEIKVGMTNEQVTTMMGESGRKSDTFHLAQQAGYEFEHEVGKRIGAAYFLSWTAGIDEVFTVTFDHENRVIYKARGGT
jgi:hypothetical protein